MFKWFVKKINNKKGFTLVELVVVIAILGILSAIAVPRFTGATANANRKTVEANLRTIDGAVAMYEANKGSKPADKEALTHETDGTLQSWPTGPDGVTYDLNATSKRAEATRSTTEGSKTGSWWKDTVGDTVFLPIDWE